MKHQIERVPSGMQFQANASGAKSAAARDVRDRRIVQPQNQAIIMPYKHIYPSTRRRIEVGPHLCLAGTRNKAGPALDHAVMPKLEGGIQKTVPHLSILPALR